MANSFGALIEITDDPSTYDRDRWINAAVEAIKATARERQYLTVDDVWARGPKPSEPRWMGLAFNEARALGFIRTTQIHERSRQSTNHGRPVRVWRSNIY